MTGEANAGHKKLFNPRSLGTKFPGEPQRFGRQLLTDPLLAPSAFQNWFSIFFFAKVRRGLSGTLPLRPHLTPWFSFLFFLCGHGRPLPRPVPVLKGPPLYSSGGREMIDDFPVGLSPPRALPVEVRVFRFDLRDPRILWWVTSRPYPPFTPFVLTHLFFAPGRPTPIHAGPFFAGSPPPFFMCVPF